MTLREHYGAALTAQERERAVHEGERLYAYYGDETARARLANVLRRGAREATGSRTGSGARLTILGTTPGAGSGAPSASSAPHGSAPTSTTPRATYYHSSLWQPTQYFQQQDLLWTRQLGPRLTTSVAVGAPSKKDVPRHQDSPDQPSRVGSFSAGAPCGRDGRPGVYLLPR